jgi:hypothetical protein
MIRGVHFVLVSFLADQLLKIIRVKIALHSRPFLGAAFL